ncbi:MAG: hypothetical protein ACI4OL_06965 [Gemmiger sp.]
MEQNFSLMAQSRANYYTAGSPVQFVRVELLKGDETGEVAVCLTFKNVGTEQLTGLVVHFKCKDPSGQILCEDDFYYEELKANSGDLFGTDDAVYISDTPISSVEVELDRAFLNGRGVDLRGYKRVRLKMPRRLPGSIARALQQRTGNEQLNCVPQDTEHGWFCACGAFHPNEENVQVCSECGAERTFVKSTLTNILEEARAAAEAQQRELNEVAQTAAPETVSEPAPSAEDQAAATAAAVAAAIENQKTQEIGMQQGYVEENNPEMDRVQRYNRSSPVLEDDEDDDEAESTRMFDAEDEEDSSRGRYADDDAESDEDVMAERIIRWAPPITAILCALIIAAALIYKFVIA